MLVEVDDRGYFRNIDAIIDLEYPALQGTTYLDHAGTTPYAKSLINLTAADLNSNLFGNPHSASESSQLSSQRINDVRLQVLTFLNADPTQFDVVFVANATAAIKLVAEALRDADGGFVYAHQREAHTSLVGVRELAREHICFDDESALSGWAQRLKSYAGGSDRPRLLLGIPAQSNMTGVRYSLQWCHSIRQRMQDEGVRSYTLLDAASVLSTSTLDFARSTHSPDFTALSFYKIFGYPDLGALVVRKQSSDVLRQKRYFGGGTVAMVGIEEAWSARKRDLCSVLEEGTLPVHSIIALGHALTVHRRIYGCMENIAAHTKCIAQHARQRLRTLTHANQKRLCFLYEGSLDSLNENPGSIIAFNICDSAGRWIPTGEVQKLAVINRIQFRVGGLCNPGGIASHLQLSDAELKHMYIKGGTCGADNEVMAALNKPSGVIRVSFGAMSRMADVDKLLSFLAEFFVDRSLPSPLAEPQPQPRQGTFHLESIAIFPIKSCAAFQIPSGVLWKVMRQGLAWDREWCLVQKGSNVALSQKYFPQMTSLCPSIDLQRRTMTVTVKSPHASTRSISVDLDEGPATPETKLAKRSGTVCGVEVNLRVYTSRHISRFFSEALGVACDLARYNREVSKVDDEPRRSLCTKDTDRIRQPVIASTFSNESPILLVSKSSVRHVSSLIDRLGKGSGSAITPATFRGNFVIAEDLSGSQEYSPYVEDDWTSLSIGSARFDVLGPCQRCQMVCVDQRDGLRSKEPLVTLAKTRRKNGRIWFGMHMVLSSPRHEEIYVKSGDGVSGA